MAQAFGTATSLICRSQQTQAAKVSELVNVQSSFLECFSELEDPRVECSRAHLLIDIIAIGILAVITEVKGWEEKTTQPVSKVGERSF
jgi:hypothetical protein